MSKPLRVAQVMGHMSGGGVEQVIMNYYRHIDHSLVQFDFIVDSDSALIPKDEINALGGRVFIVPPYKKLLQYIKACENIFREQQPDVVHSNLNTLSIFPLRAAKLANIPIRIAHSHNATNLKAPDHAKTLANYFLRSFSRVYPTHLAACSQKSGNWLFGKKAISTGQVHIIRNAIEFDRFNFNSTIREQKRAELGISENQIIIGQVGRLTAQKNQKFTLSCFKNILDSGINAILCFVGQGNQYKILKQLVNKLGLNNNVKFLGIRTDVEELYQAFDVLAFPSTYEGLGLAAIEAQYSGLPVVLSDKVPRETVLIPHLVQTLKLSDSVEKWSQVLIRSATSCDISQRSDPNQQAVRDKIFVESGYEIQECANSLVDWYIDMIK